MVSILFGKYSVLIGMPLKLYAEIVASEPFSAKFNDVILAVLFTLLNIPLGKNFTLFPILTVTPSSFDSPNDSNTFVDWRVSKSNCSTFIAL